MVGIRCFGLLVLPVAALALSSETVDAEQASSVTSEIESLHCTYHSAAVSSTRSIREWEVCSSADGRNFRLVGRDAGAKDLAEVSYISGHGVSALSARYLDRVAELTISSVLDVLELSARYHGSLDVGRSETLSANAQIPMSAMVCDEAGEDADSLFERSDIIPGTPYLAPAEDFNSFFNSASVEAVDELKRQIVGLANEHDVLSGHRVPGALMSARSNGEPSAIPVVFAMMQEALAADGQTRGFESCAMLALGATGAIIGVLSSDPALGIACATSCGATLGCLGQAVVGGGFSPGCAGSTAACLGCVGLGYSENFANCFRQFTQMY
ncbi:hypothetical protein [Halomonas denitrificans]|nr:hypothetical protein [Halomonas denitrificans]